MKISELLNENESDERVYNYYFKNIQILGQIINLFSTVVDARGVDYAIQNAQDVLDRYDNQKWYSEFLAEKSKITRNLKKQYYNQRKILENKIRTGI